MRLGFLPVSDCAPVIFAHEAGLFTKYGVDVQLQRERSWNSIRDKISNGDLDAAHAPATLPFLANIGLESDPCACVSGLILSLQGNSIVVSRQLWDVGARDSCSLREVIYQNWRKRTLTFAVVFPHSTACLLLRRWLATARINADTQVRIIVVPPEQMFPTLKLGYIDGFCVGEPWASLTTTSGLGVTLSTSAELSPLHPEKLLMVRQSFAIGRADEHEALAAALIEACAHCAEPCNFDYLSRVLEHSSYVNAPADCIKAGLSGSAIYYGNHANEPTDARASWLMTGLYELLAQTPFRMPGDRTPVLINVFRRDIYARAFALFSQIGPQAAVTVAAPQARSAVPA